MKVIIVDGTGSYGGPPPKTNKKKIQINGVINDNTNGSWNNLLFFIFPRFIITVLVKYYVIMFISLDFRTICININ